MTSGRYPDSDGVVHVGPATLTLHRARAAPPAQVADGTDCWWLMLAADMAGLARGNQRPWPGPRSPAHTGQPRSATFTPGAGAGSVRAARAFTLAALRRWDWAERREDITIVVAELLTNALRHAGSGPDSVQSRRPIRLGLLQPGPCLLCAVADPGAAAPVPQAPGSLAETGRGLQIIRALSDGWGYTVLNDAGKVVWATFAPRLMQPSARYPANTGNSAPRLGHRAADGSPFSPRSC
jgi:anti-sigma regulatory factor (Ser/Thr protein kinase)